jgi:hypothetical protein
MDFEDGRLKVVGIGGTLREGSTSVVALRRALAAAEEAGAEVELAEKVSPARGTGGRRVGTAGIAV